MLSVSWLRVLVVDPGPDDKPECVNAKDNVPSQTTLAVTTGPSEAVPHGLQTLSPSAGDLKPIVIDAQNYSQVCGSSSRFPVPHDRSSVAL